MFKLKKHRHIPDIMKVGVIFEYHSDDGIKSFEISGHDLEENKILTVSGEFARMDQYLEQLKLGKVRIIKQPEDVQIQEDKETSSS